MTKEKIIAEIGKRIKSEYNKHSKSIPRWELIAASKIWSMLSGEATWQEEMIKITEQQIKQMNEPTWWGGKMNDGDNPDVIVTMSPTDVENERFKHNASDYNPSVREKNNTTGETTIEFPKQHQPEPYNPNNPSLDTMTFRFEQDENCVDGGEGETLIVEAKSSLGIDGDGGAFYVLRTEQWAISEIDELIVMLRRVEAAVNATNPTSIHVR